jgi:two-component system, OmpR family, phosphate regulon sensor histidine kinase PhoR
LQVASPQTVAALLKESKDALLSVWETGARRFPESVGLTHEQLRDHLPLLLDELARELAREHSDPQLEAFCVHGEHRLELGISISQVIMEYRLLRHCIKEHVERMGMPITGKTEHLIDDIIDEGIKAAVETYIERRDNDEKRRREEYLTFVVHDLRSPLAAIYNAIHLIERDLGNTPGSERIRTIQGAIKRNIERMQALIVKLLQEEQNIRVSSNLQVRRQAIDLWPIVDSAVRALAPLSASSSTEVENLVPQDIAIHADTELLGRVFQNLISNAIEHTPKGKVSIGARFVHAQGVECWVSDNGYGMPEDLQKQIQEKRRPSPKQGRGLGLGLAVVQQIVRAHDGRLELDSKEGQGTTVRFTIPQ